MKIHSIALITFAAASILSGCKGGDAPPCPPSYVMSTPEQQQGGFECSCADVPSSGGVWGTDIYTQDSSICRAALHAGVIGAKGGKVTAKPAPGCPKYQGSERHGVSTGSWGVYSGSFVFPGHGKGACL